MDFGLMDQIRYDRMRRQRDAFRAGFVAAAFIILLMACFIAGYLEVATR